MKITPVEHGLDLTASSLYRSPGLHASDIYNAYYQELEPKRFKKGTSPDPLRMGAGLMLESVLEEGLKQRMAERPGELLTKEGIAYSPDMLISENNKLRLGETKLTWMSSREVPRVSSNSFPQKFDKWMTQMMFYCNALETPHSRLYSYFVNGNYRPMVPELLAWDIEFSARELREEYDKLLNYAKFRKML